MLKDKAHIDFNKWYKASGSMHINFSKFSLNIALAMSNAIIIEYLESVNIHIKIEYGSMGSGGPIMYCAYVFYSRKISYYTDNFESKNEALKEAFEIASNIYNNHISN